MIATRTQNGASSRSRIVEPPTVRQQAPSERDFELFFALQARCLSTRAAAEQFGISQTRVLQVRDRVAEWLGTTLLPMRGNLSAGQRVQVIGEMARHRLEFLLSQAVEAWHASKGTTTKVRVGESLSEVTTTYTTQGDIRYLVGASRLNEGMLKLAEGVEAAMARLDTQASGVCKHPDGVAIDKVEAHREADASRSPMAHASRSPSLVGDCSRDEGSEACSRLAAQTQPDANDDELETYDEFAERRREFLAALDDNTAPVQPPRTDANGMLIEESEEHAEAEDMSLLLMAAGAEGMAAPIGDAPSLTHRVSVARPLSRKERRARKRILEKLRRKAR
jgi:hypothetical protein